MSILIKNENEEQTRQLNEKIERIRLAPIRSGEIMCQLWMTAFDEIWHPSGAGTIEERLAGIGTDGAEMLALSNAFTTFLLSTLTGKRDDLVGYIQSRLSSLPAFTVAEDGTITLS